MAPAGHQEVVDELRAAGCVFAEEEARILLESAPDDVAGLVARRVAGEPLEHLVGWVEFAGTRLAVTPRVFVPRQRTELLAHIAAEACGTDDTVVDLCCGIGAVAHVVARQHPRRLFAVDIDPAATACARRNLPDATVLTGDLWDPLPDELHGSVDVVVANAPYVPTAAVGSMPREAREHEPRHALDGGDDGLQVARRIVTGSDAWLTPHGMLAIETSSLQADALTAAVTGAGLVAEVVEDDESGGVVVVGRRHPRPA
ncbi:putative protein N(5)-glutamine methyltransferase [uncultured Williamsia sp.]|uniref:putative protein N(5)-glutamine methyltransferase n=1 Tax=uncultured Williamsia sp. TaxID=259311 RepID=UPI0026398271|nr:putative protein N(5)-glutamine methyltransferase [uncultured Williamsia sp.]